MLRDPEPKPREINFVTVACSVVTCLVILALASVTKTYYGETHTFDSGYAASFRDKEGQLTKQGLADLKKEAWEDHLEWSEECEEVALV